MDIEFNKCCTQDCKIEAHWSCDCLGVLYYFCDACANRHSAQNIRHNLKDEIKLTPIETQILMDNILKKLKLLEDFKKNLITTTKDLISKIIQSQGETLNQVKNCRKSLIDYHSYLKNNSRLFKESVDALKKNQSEIIISDNLNTKKLKNAIDEYYSKNFFIRNPETSQLIKKISVNDLKFNIPFIQNNNKIEILAKIGISIAPDSIFNHCIYAIEKNFLITDFNKDKIKIWNLENYGAAIELPVLSKSITCLEITNNGRLLIIGFNQAIATMHLDDGFDKKFIIVKGNIEMIRVSYDDTFFFAIDYDGNIKKLSIYLKLEKEAIGAHKFCHFGSIKCAKIIENDNSLITGGSDGYIKIWDKDLKKLAIIDAHMRGVDFIVLANHKKYIASVGKDLNIKLWRLDNYQNVYIIKINKDPIIIIEFSINDHQIITLHANKVNIYSVWNNDDTNSFKNKNELLNYLQIFPNCFSLSQCLKSIII